MNRYTSEILPSRDELWSALGARPQASTSDPMIVSACIVAAGLLGAGVALLLAPKSGAELRKDLRRRLRFDGNERFHQKVEAEGGLPGPIKHLAP